MDECFLDFLPDGDRWTAKPLLHEEQNLIIFKAFTKLYGMAGVRLGLTASVRTQDCWNRCGLRPAWGVSSLAQAAGLAALEETAYVEKAGPSLPNSGPRLTAGLPGRWACG